jgi:hypothetical protein
MKISFGSALSAVLTLVLVVAGLFAVTVNEQKPVPLSVTFPDPERVQSVLLVCGGVTAVIDLLEDDEDRLNVILQSRRIRKIDFVLTTKSHETIPSVAGIPVGETVRLGDCPDGIPIGEALLNMKSGVPVLCHGNTAFDILPLTNSHPHLRGASMLVSDGEKIRVQPDGSRWE